MRYVQSVNVETFLCSVWFCRGYIGIIAARYLALNEHLVMQLWLLLPPMKTLVIILSPLSGFVRRCLPALLIAVV